MSTLGAGRLLARLSFRRYVGFPENTTIDWIF
jgi:hypothetical protein